MHPSNFDRQWLEVIFSRVLSRLCSLSFMLSLARALSHVHSCSLPHSRSLMLALYLSCVRSLSLVLSLTHILALSLSSSILQLHLTFQSSEVSESRRAVGWGRRLSYRCPSPQRRWCLGSEALWGWPDVGLESDPRTDKCRCHSSSDKVKFSDAVAQFAIKNPN